LKLVIMGVKEMQKSLRTTLLVICDAILIPIAYYISIFIRFEGQLNGNVEESFITFFLPLILIKMIAYAIFGLYNSLWKYAGTNELIQVIYAAIIGNTVFLSYTFLIQNSIPRSIFLLMIIFDTFLIAGIRFGYRMLRYLKRILNITNSKDCKRIMIIGAGEAGAMVIKEFNGHPELLSNPVVIVDDDIGKIGKKLRGVPILGDTSNIPQIAMDKEVDEIIIATPSADVKEARRIIEECSKTKCRLKKLPGVYELIDGQVSIKEIKDVEIEDLLGREQVSVDLEEISQYLSEKVVLITGGGGSIGSELCRQICNFKPKKLIILDIYENNAYDLQMELNRDYPNLNIEVLIASVRDKKSLNDIFVKNKPNVVFHAAAHKHVPLMEACPKEAIKNNVFGTMNVAELSDLYRVEKFVLISTDKAVNPTNIMGATKRVAEIIIQSMNKHSKTEYVAVRFGNVLGSNGSVIPLFKKQIATGGSVTITHKEITRFFMTIPEAVQLVIQAGAMAKGGEIFVLDMGDPVKILDLAKNLIRLSGFEPNEDIDIEVTGLRPGEKLYEELLMDEEGLTATKHDKIFIGQPTFTDMKFLQMQLENLNEVLYKSESELREYMKTIVPTYSNSG
jgi:FlaA1/EpsC-like NDP-sugar epimerase